MKRQKNNIGKEEYYELCKRIGMTACFIILAIFMCTSLLFVGMFFLAENSQDRLFLISFAIVFFVGALWFVIITNAIEREYEAKT